MQRIEDVVNGVLEALRQRGLSDYSLKCINWSVYRPIINWHHVHGTDICSLDLIEKLCEQKRICYENNEIKRKYYRAFVTAAFRVRSYVETGKVDFSIVKETKRYIPGKEYLELIDSILKTNNLTESNRKKLDIIMRYFFCFFEERHTNIQQFTDQDFLDFIPIAAERNPHNMTCVMRALRYISQYLNEHELAKINIDFTEFRPKSLSTRMIAPYTQDDISAVLNVIESNSKTPKRDKAIILLAFNSGLRCVDIRNLELYNINWKRQELSIVQKKTGIPIAVPLNGKTLNAVAEYILEERPESKDDHVFLRAYPPYSRINSTSPLDYMIDKYCRLASIEKLSYRSFHSLRRAFGTELAIAEVPLTSISQMLGHSDISSDKAYLNFNKTQTSLCASNLSEVPITKGVYASYFLETHRKSKRGGDRV